MKRILHVGLGPLGIRMIQDVHEREFGHVVSAVDRDPALAGQTLAKVVPGGDPRITIFGSLEDVPNWDLIDAAIVTTASDLPACADTFRFLLRRGKAVVSTCEELVYPWLRHVALAEELDELAKRSGGRLLGTGVNPGFLMDALPAFLTSVCKGVRAIKCERIQDASVRRIPFQKKIGAGLDDAGFAAKVRDGTLRHVGLGESLHFLSHYLGLPIERWDEDLSLVRADRDLQCGVGLVARGRVAGVRQIARGFADERVVIHLEFVAAVGQRDPYDRVIVDGDPPLDVVIPGGVHGDVATSAIALNALPRVIAAEPGLHTMATIAPPFHANARSYSR
jgi:4-hydroxy-tetrahydrodipicolinate reductase